MLLSFSRLTGGLHRNRTGSCDNIVRNWVHKIIIAQGMEKGDTFEREVMMKNICDIFVWCGK